MSGRLRRPGRGILGLFWAPRAAAAAKWELGEWIHKSAPKAAREAPLAVGLCPVQHSCTGKSSGAVTGARMLGSS